jgi:hypothetical protein
MLRRFLLLTSLLCLYACAPVMLGRTPTPAAPGVTETSVVLGYSFGLTEVPRCDYTCEYVGPAYWPMPLPLTIHVAYGRSETLETNVGLMLLPLPNSPGFGVRYGIKERFQEEPLELAYDFGGSLYLTNVGLDGGLLAAVSLSDVKLYGALRGFGNIHFATGIGGGAALTLGSAFPVGEGSSVMLELSFLANFYNGFAAERPAQPVGFALVPALSFSF